jgi:hypothetical protein
VWAVENAGEREGGREGRDVNGEEREGEGKEFSLSLSLSLCLSLLCKPTALSYAVVSLCRADDAAQE